MVDFRRSIRTSATPWATTFGWQCTADKARAPAAVDCLERATLPSPMSRLGSAMLTYRVHFVDLTCSLWLPSLPCLASQPYSTQATESSFLHLNQLTDRLCAHAISWARCEESEGPFQQSTVELCKVTPATLHGDVSPCVKSLRSSFMGLYIYV